MTHTCSICGGRFTDSEWLFHKGIHTQTTFGTVSTHQLSDLTLGPLPDKEDVLKVLGGAITPEQAQKRAKRRKGATRRIVKRLRNWLGKKITP